MHALVLAGGFGTRLRSVVSDVPKPLAPVDGIPFLALLLPWLARGGVTSATLSLHYQWEKIRDYFAAHPAPFPLDFAVEPEPLGTGGAMRFALKGRPRSEPVLVLNGDSFVKLGLAAFIAQRGALCMALREVADSGRYGTVQVERGIITAFGEGRAGAPGLINAGVYLLKPELFDEPGLPDAFSFERDFLPSRLAALKPRAFVAEEYFIDIGIPDDYARAQQELRRQMES